jgi:hypothetical protein
LVIVKLLAKVKRILTGNWVDKEGLKFICNETD